MPWRAGSPIGCAGPECVEHPDCRLLAAFPVWSGVRGVPAHPIDDPALQGICELLAACQPIRARHGWGPAESRCLPCSLDVTFAGSEVADVRPMSGGVSRSACVRVKKPGGWRSHGVLGRSEVTKIAGHQALARRYNLFGIEVIAVRRPREPRLAQEGAAVG